MKLRPEILRLALPSILANITVPLVGMVDLAVAGHLQGDFSSAAFIGGISVGSMLFELLYWNFGFLRIGTGGLTAQAYGRGDVEYQAFCLRRALRIAFISALALIALQWLIVQGAFLVVECSPEVRTLAKQYFYIRIWAAPATISLFAFKGWFIGMQDSVRAMAADLTVNIVNIVASITLALLLGFKGIALGTVLAQWSGFAYCCIAIKHRFSKLFLPPRTKTFSPKNVEKVLSDSGKRKSFDGDRAFFKMNRDLVLRSVSMIAVYIGFTVISARHGDLMLASASILMKLLMLFSYFSDGFAYAGEALTGRFIGEGSDEGVRSTIRGTFLWGGGCALLFLAIYGLGGVPLLRLFSGDGAVVDAARQFLPWLMLMPVIGIPAFIWDGIYTGATRTRDMMLSVVLCAIGFFATYIGGYYLLKADDVLAIHILMAAYFVHLTIRSVYLTLRWRQA
ncbi:MAG: MATE family efflux transporter [Bacteroidales bacterium]|nr:MATE family efflux transporter [Bacteroidales bacterium]